MPKITKARGATAVEDGSNLLPNGQTAEAEPQEQTAEAPPAAELERPNKSATRGEWDAYAESLGIDPAELANKDAVITAVDEAEQS